MSVKPALSTVNGETYCQSPFSDTWWYTRPHRWGWIVAHPSLRKVIPYINRGKTAGFFKRGVVYLVAEWCRCLLWLSHFLCIRSLARQQWWCNVNGLQILKEERSGETEAAMFVCVCRRACARRACVCAWERRGGGSSMYTKHLMNDKLYCTHCTHWTYCILSTCL